MKAESTTNLLPASDEIVGILRKLLDTAKQALNEPSVDNLNAAFQATSAANVQAAIATEPLVTCAAYAVMYAVMLAHYNWAIYNSAVERYVAKVIEWTDNAVKLSKEPNG